MQARQVRYHLCVELLVSMCSSKLGHPRAGIVHSFASGAQYTRSAEVAVPTMRLLLYNTHFWHLREASGEAGLAARHVC
jgi:hypothetical protein